MANDAVTTGSRWKVRLEALGRGTLRKSDYITVLGRVNPRYTTAVVLVRFRYDGAVCAQVTNLAHFLSRFEPTDY